MSKHLHGGFTLIEVLVASTLFVSLMGVAAFSFQRMSAGARYAESIIALHKKSDDILRLMTADLRLLQPSCAVHFQQTTAPYSITFAIPTTNQTQKLQHDGQTESGISAVGYDEEQRADIIWARWEWGDSDIKRGVSRSRHKGAHIRRYIDDTEEALRSVALLPAGTQQSGMQINGRAPVPHQHFVNFWGNGNFKIAAADGSVNAASGDQIKVYTHISSSQFNDKDCVYFESINAPWRVHNDYSHWYTSYLVGNTGDLSAEAYAVCNADGKTFNKDKINLMGTPDVDADGNYYYPSQVFRLFHGVEYMWLDLYKIDGSKIAVGDEDDTLNDGATSIDISGIDTAGYGSNLSKRPVLIDISFLLHSLNESEPDEADFDEDGVITESLTQAVRDRVADEKHPSRTEKIESFKKHVRSLGETALYIQYSVNVGM